MKTLLAALAVTFSGATARGDEAADSVIIAYLEALSTLERHEIAALALTLGVVMFAVVTSVMLVRTRARAAIAESAARTEILRLRAEVDRANTLLMSEPQILVVWGPADEEPEILGDVTIVAPIPVPRRVLAFGTWLAPDKAQEMEHSVDNLRARGEAFSLALTTSGGRHVEAEGRAVGGRAVLRLRDVSGARRAYAELAAHHKKVVSDIDTMRTLVEALPSPMWARDEVGQLAWVNPAYVRAVEARDAADVVARGLELLAPNALEATVISRMKGEPHRARLPVIVTGTRRFLDVLDVPASNGSAGIGIDTTEVEALRDEITRTADGYRRTLDRLSTGVAIFGVDQRLTFFNAAYASLWGFDAEFLEQRPTDSAVLDRLRAARRLPEEHDYRQWKSHLHEAYRSIEAKEHSWHLPDGRTLRVVTTPNPEGGVTYLFDDLTEGLELRRRYDALTRVQGETLDHLSEAVAVFGSDGRLRLHNPTFAQMWKLSQAALAERPHVETVIDLCRSLYPEDAVWQTLRASITGIEQRTPFSARLERRDGAVVECATVPLPDGATLVAFHDVTDSVNVERVLRERNDALVAADELKNAFVQHVSYELRSPLTNIIGFAHLLDDQTTGPLSEKQREYLGYITSSSAALLVIINNILDLATIDAGAMTLDLGPVDIRASMEAAAEGVRDRLVDNGIALDIRRDCDLGTFVADERRIRQVLYNLLSNAVGFSPVGGTVTFTAERRPDAIVFSVSDQGPGIPPDLRERVFDRFETHALGSRHRGAGLGLTIVRSFVELHGGAVSIDSVEGHGTTVTCAFPIERAVAPVAAE